MWMECCNSGLLYPFMYTDISINKIYYGGRKVLCSNKRLVLLCVTEQLKHNSISVFVFPWKLETKTDPDLFLFENCDWVKSGKINLKETFVFIYNVHVALTYSSRMAEKLKIIPLSVNLIVKERDLPTSNLLCYHFQKNKDWIQEYFYLHFAAWYFAWMFFTFLWCLVIVQCCGCCFVVSV